MRERLTQKFAAAADRGKKPSEKKPASGELRRNLEGFEYDSSKAKVLKKALHNLNVSLGAMISAMRDMAILRGSEITPDGMLGGRGFIMSFKEMKATLNDAITNLSDMTDTLADELTNPKWGLSPNEKEKVKEEQEVIDDKVEHVEEEAPAETAPIVSLAEGVVDQLPADAAGEIPDSATPADIPMGVNGITPPVVKNSAEVDAVARYSDLITGKTADKVANVLSKSILANLVQ
jgi:hypothetical protein